MDLGTWHRTRHGSSPKEGSRCQWAPEPGNLGCRRRRSPGPPGEEQFRDPPLVDACTLPAAEMPRQALRTDVRQLRSRVQAPPAASCKLPLLDRPLALFLTICALRIGQTSGLVVDQRLPSPPPMDKDALCLRISDTGGLLRPPTRCRTFPLAEMHSTFLSCSGAPGLRSTHRGTDQLFPNFNLRQTCFVPTPD